MVSKKKAVGIVLLILVSIFGALLALGALVQMGVITAPPSSNSSTTSQPQPQPAQPQQAQPQQPAQPQPQPAQPPPSDPLSDPQALVREVRAYMQQQGWSALQQEWDTNMTRVAEGIVKSRYLEDSAVVVITAQGSLECWSGSIMGSDSVSTTREACNTAYFSIPCSGFFGSYSLALQRTVAGGPYGSELLVQVWKDGELLKQGSTTAEYGVVSFAGDC